MISFANTAWEAISLAILFLLGLAFMPTISRLFGVRAHHGVILYVWHSLFCVLYILYSMTNPADTIRYFLSSLSWDQGPALGTRFIIWLNSLFSQGLAMSYGGSFFAYNILGSFGLIAFSGALREAFAGKSGRVRQVIFLFPFMPGFSFWSTAIGKDSIAFFSVGIICWASAQPYRRFPAILFALFAILMVRPHIAGFLLIALALSYSLAKQGGIALRLLISSLILPSSIIVVMVALSYVGLEQSDSLTEYVEQRQNYNTEGASSVNIANTSIPVRLFTYVFRPLFLDAGGVFGLVVSFENLMLLGAFIAALNGKFKRNSSLSKFQRLFFFLYVSISWIALANTTANLGIAIRQKTMFTPMLLMLLISYFPRKRYISPFAYFRNPDQRPLGHLPNHNLQRTDEG